MFIWGVFGSLCIYIASRNYVLYEFLLNIESLLAFAPFPAKSK